MLYLFILLIPIGEMTSSPTRSLLYVMYIVNIYIMYPETGNIWYTKLHVLSNSTLTGGP